MFHITVEWQTVILQGANAIVSRFEGITPIGTGIKYDCTHSRIHIFTGATPTGPVLDSVLNDHLNRIDRVASNPLEYAKIPPLDIIVLTDGVPSALH